MPPPPPHRGPPRDPLCESLPESEPGSTLTDLVGGYDQNRGCLLVVEQPQVYAQSPRAPYLQASDETVMDSDPWEVVPCTDLKYR